MHGQIQKSFRGRMGGVPELCISFVTFKNFALLSFKYTRVRHVVTSLSRGSLEP